MRPAAEIYQEYVVAHDLERRALLEALRARFARSPAVLYPGCNVHVTPSFFFPHVVYVDRSDFARAFFADAAGVGRVIDDHRRYRARPFVRFVAADYTAPLPFSEASFDLLLALHAPGIARACAHHVRPGGLVVTDAHRGAALEAAARPDLELRAVAFARRGAIQLVEDDLEGALRSAAAPLEGTARGRRGARPRAARRADYYLFARARSTPGRSYSTPR